MNSRRNLLLAGAAIMASGCGGGSSPPASGAIVPRLADQATGGLWFGTVTFDSNMITEEFIGMSSGDGRFRFVSVDSAVAFLGQAVVSGTSFPGDGRAFADTGINWLDGNHVVDLSLTAEITERDSVGGGWATSSGESGTFEFFYDGLHDKDSDTALLEAVWSAYDDLGNPVATFTIDPGGGFNGQNAQGCMSSGQFAAIDQEDNLYEIQSEITGCPIAGSYSGFAFLADLVTVNDALALSLDNGERTILLGLQR